MATFYRWGSTASRLVPPRGGSLLFTTMFADIPGTHFIDEQLRRLLLIILWPAIIVLPSNIFRLTFSISRLITYNFERTFSSLVIFRKFLLGKYSVIFQISKMELFFVMLDRILNKHMLVETLNN